MHNFGVCDNLYHILFLWLLYVITGRTSLMGHCYIMALGDDCRFMFMQHVYITHKMFKYLSTNKCSINIKLELTFLCYESVVIHYNVSTELLFLLPLGKRD